MWLLHGRAMFGAFESVFFDPDSVPDLAPAVLTALAVVAVLTFAPLNAPAEELVYRGYGQQRLARRMPLAAAIAVSAALFGVQHVFYAPTPDAVVVYVCAFFVWGLGSGIIAHRQGRLMPIIIAHGIVNLGTTRPHSPSPSFPSETSRVRRIMNPDQQVPGESDAARSASCDGPGDARSNSRSAGVWRPEFPSSSRPGELRGSWGSGCCG